MTDQNQQPDNTANLDTAVSQTPSSPTALSGGDTSVSQGDTGHDAPVEKGDTDIYRDQVDPNAEKPVEDKADQNAQQQSEEKPAEEKPDEPQEDQQEKPIEYKDFTLPENHSVDSTTLSKVKEFAQPRKMTQEDAQGIVDIIHEHSQRMIEGFVNFDNKRGEAYLDEARKHPLLQGEAYQKNLTMGNKILKKAVSMLPDEHRHEVDDMLKETQAGNHKGMMLLLGQIGSLISEDTLVIGDAITSHSKGGLGEIYTNSDHN